MSWSDKYEAVIGLEVHSQLATATKIFCGCRNRFGDEPNTNICPVCLGLPGTLPVMNKKALEFATQAALALNCEVQPWMKFDRKNYFYPDLPKAYQISQYDRPLALGGYVEINVEGQTKRIGITRVHMEEDAGKLIHASDDFSAAETSNVDYNRVGTPLIEIVSEPDMRTPEEAHAYLTALKAILLYCEVSDCNMEEGSLRCDANISLRPKGQKEFGTKAEIKNMNSFRYVQLAIEFELDRQSKLLDKGERVVQETRLWDSVSKKTRSMRSKEEAHDYRYFPEPDLVTFRLSEVFVSEQRSKLPELPAAKAKRFAEEYGIPVYDAGVLTSSKSLAQYFEDAVTVHKNPKGISNWIMSELMRELKEAEMDVSRLKVNPSQIAGLVKLVDEGTITGKIAKDVFAEMIATGQGPQAIVESKGLKQVTDEGAIEEACRKAIAENPDPVAQYKKGKKNSLGFLVGQVMKATKGQANPPMVNRILTRLLEE